MKFAVAINQQPSGAPTSVFDFVYQQNENLHVWKGKFATNMRELSEQVNEAYECLRSLGMDVNFVTLRIVELEFSPEESSTVKSLLEANEELREIVYGKQAA